jgi:hypothetical protein
MAIEMQNSTDQSTTSLLSGILDDVQKLVKQQMQITRKEVTEEIQNVAQAAVFFAAGAAVLFFGTLILGFGLVHLLHWATAPAGSDPASLPLWACHAIVGGPLGLLGLVLTWLGYRKVTSINPLHNPAADALKDNVNWAANPMR